MEAEQRTGRARNLHEQVDTARQWVGGQDAREAGIDSRGCGGRNHHSDEVVCDDDNHRGHGVGNPVAEARDGHSSHLKDMDDGLVVESESDHSAHCAESRPEAVANVSQNVIMMHERRHEHRRDSEQWHL